MTSRIQNVAKNMSSKKLMSCGLISLALSLSACGGSNVNGNSSSSSMSNHSSSSSSSSLSTSSQSSSISSFESSSSASSMANVYEDGDFILGMDISYWSEQLDRGFTYIDTDGQSKDLLSLFKAHGVNFIRLRTFVDPWANYGYASGVGSGCSRKAQAYNDKMDILTMAQAVKDAGMGLLLDFHYSDTWADPGKQVIPEAWRSATNIQELANEVNLYTRDVLESLKAVNALPDMVQIGNETTPGMLIHIPTSNTDCWGNNSRVSSGPNGRASNANWYNLAQLLKAGINGVNSVDSNIKTVLHLESTARPNDVEWWVDSALAQGVEFDVLALSAYEVFQGPASAWRSTFNRLANRYPNLHFAVAEYNDQGRLLNDIMHELPNGRGLGTFFWEPTQSGSWGSAIFTQQGNSFRANASDFAVLDQILADYPLRKLD